MSNRNSQVQIWLLQVEFWLLQVKLFHNKQVDVVLATSKNQAPYSYN